MASGVIKQRNFFEGNTDITQAAAYAKATIIVQGNLPSIGFHNPGRVGALLYVDTDGGLYFKSDNAKFKVNLTQVT